MCFLNGVLTAIKVNTFKIKGSILLNVQGFPNVVDFWGAFGQNGQKLHENHKINIWEAKQWEILGRHANFSGSGWFPTLPPLGETLVSVIW